MKYRCFIALEAPDPVRASLSARLNELKRNPGVNWVKPENLHLTLLFLGDIDVMELSELEGAIASVCANCEAFELQMLGLELFPAKAPRLIWADLRSQDDSIFQLHKRLLSAIRGLGYAPDAKPLKLHITLGRIKSALPVWLEQSIMQSRIESGVHAYDRISFYRSVLKPEGPTYHLIKHYDLN